MTYRFSRSLSILIFLSCLCATVPAKEVTLQGFSTSATKFVAHTGSSEKITGTASLTIERANYDDTVTGRITFQLDEASIEYISNLSGRDTVSVSKTMVLNDVTAEFKRGATCPEINIIANELDLVIDDTNLRINKLVFSIIENPDELTRLFCAWTRQINAERIRRGIITAINRYIESGQ